MLDAHHEGNEESVMSGGSEASSVFLYGLNISVLLFGILVGAMVRRFSTSKKVRPIRWGVAFLVTLNVVLLGLILRHLTNMPSQAVTDGVQQFQDSVSVGSMIGTVIFPGLVMLCVIWLYIRVRAGRIVQRVESADDKDASRVVSLGNKVATVIFWVVGGSFLLLALGVLVFGR